MADDIVLPIPNLELPQHHFTLMQPNLGHLHQNALKELLVGIEKDRKSHDRLKYTDKYLTLYSNC